MPGHPQSQTQWRSQGLPGWTSHPPGRPQWGKKMKKIWGKMREPTGKWGKIEEMFFSCPPGSERLATALVRHPVSAKIRGRQCPYLCKYKREHPLLNLPLVSSDSNEFWFLQMERKRLYSHNSHFGNKIKLGWLRATDAHVKFKALALVHSFSTQPPTPPCNSNMFAALRVVEWVALIKFLFGMWHY